MPYYDSAVQVRYVTRQFMGTSRDYPEADRAHAVERSEQEDRHGSVTLCGLSTSAMEYQEAHDLNFWPPARFSDKACQRCLNRVP
ncbi:hypothetical protein [Nocardia sp. NBC_01327]|uniref:hypothetical protein n=1 Tax=Nocardia sp. NBC_01327 TaxID=2903593 RepID=UPI002E154028|nr:hypothetical protein OG326_42325 [Nocardia sp. NBC_01327]